MEGGGGRIPRATTSCHTPGVQRRACRASPSPVQRIARARGAPPSSELPVVRAAHVCIATTPAASVPTSTATASSTNAQSGLYQPKLRATRGRAAATSAAAPSHRSAAHAMRTSVRPEGPRRETLCGALARPVNGQYFTAMHSRACRTCTEIVDSNPLRFGISASNELSRLRSLLDDIDSRRVEPRDALRWIRANSP